MSSLLSGKSGKYFFAGGILVIALLFGGLWLSKAASPAAQEAPEAEQVLAVQQHMPFQILIPAYMPAEFDRAKVAIKVDEIGPGGEPMTQLSYRAPGGIAIFVKEWVPVNPDKEILAASRPVETKWGRAWLLTQEHNLAALWVDVGPLRLSIYSPNPDQVTTQKLLEMADTLGPASNRQVFSFALEMPKVRDVEPPPPVEVPINAAGVQELTLVVTPGGYTPVRFSVKKGVPVHLIFRQLGQVGCGNTLIFPADPPKTTVLTLKSLTDKQTLDFTPQQTGKFSFNCSHQMYRGEMTVRP